VNATGALLRRYRAARALTQEQLALAAKISTRHLSFVETGRARASAEMVALLARALGLTGRERNALLRAAGFAPVQQETELDDPSMAEMRVALRLILERQQPFAAVVFDRRWDILMVNEAFRRFFRDKALPAPYAVSTQPRVNWLRALLDPGPLRERILNWPEVARAVRARVRREDPGLLPDAGLPPDAQTEPETESGLIIPIKLRLGAREVRLFSTVTSLGTAQDVTLQELRIDSFHSFDEETARLLAALS
jgi:transcriptional regulator with XRE-family HTH domain